MIRVAVTTDRFGEVSPWYSDCGLVPVSVPTIQVAAAPVHVLEQARSAVATAEMVLVTSPRTPRLLWPEGGMPPVPAVVVGESTADEVASRGGSPVLVGSSGLAELARAMVRNGCPEQVVFPRAAGSDPASLTPLEDAGVTVVGFDVYRSVPIPPSSAPVEAVSFASPSAVEGWLLGRCLEGLVVAAIGLTTADAVAAHRSPDVVPDRPSHRAMAEALAHHLEVNV